MYRAITYAGPENQVTVQFDKRIYSFEWQKSLGVGHKKNEVCQKHAMILANNPHFGKHFILE